MVTRVQPSPFEKSTWRSRSSEWLDKHQKLVSGFLAVAAGVLSCCLNAAPLPVSIVSVASIAEMLASNSFKTAQSVKHDTSFPQSHATSAEVGVSRPPARRASGTEGLLPQEMEGLVGGANAADGASDQRLAPTSTEAGLGEVGANGAGPQSCARRSRSFS